MLSENVCKQLRKTVIGQVLVKNGMIHGGSTFLGAVAIQDGHGLKQYE